ncbi:hypothetical protein IEQ34_015881 [Dendrobium chrysotoxum]|uniref:Uncharacterized protein n=1 Tax=Dendrobium chrysotoxum TaxID=161865 RepID=A0AAV7G206_DENCH|nr:hypothetical protein IEQ34_015881 [Dendrobium chrysotoxum]
MAVMAKCLQPIIILVLVLVAIKIFGRHGFWWRKEKKRDHSMLEQSSINCKNTSHIYLSQYKTFRLYAPFRNLIYITDPESWSTY